jgi:hypothetical protein
MKLPLILAASTLLVSGCESFNAKVDASRQERCQRADWAQVGERDGFDNVTNVAQRYQAICGELFQPEPYKEGFQKGAARRPRPPV